MTQTIAVVDYGSGNLHSVSRAIERVGGSALVTRDPDEVAGADALVIPGVGHFGACMRAICHHGVDGSIERYDHLLAAIKSSPYLKAIEGNLTVAFVPYANIDNISPGIAIYGCHLGLLWCSQVGSVSRVLDGEVNRKHPIRNVILRGAMVEVELLPTWIVATIIVRELVIAGIRQAAAAANVVIAARPLGKAKTASTLLGMTLLLLAFDAMTGGPLEATGWADALEAVGFWTMVVATVLTVVSGWDYLRGALPLLQGRPT